MERHPYDCYFDLLTPVLNSKCEELELLDYGKVSNQMLWSYLTRKKWKKAQDNPCFSALVNEVLAVKPGDFMNFQTVDAFRSPNWFTEVEEGDLNALLYGERKI
ncbi:post-transcriptional regulator [Bacillus spongiae]|uniref:Post-transcriptional regulator n=1 Tax=Bacillus spongiae TaxID=2683610 RepID=A0ABU8H8R4_9BACI